MPEKPTYEELEQRVKELEKEAVERKRAEEALKREKERAKEYLHIAGVMLASVDADENITLINKKGCEILGYNERELIGRNWFDILVPQGIRDEIRGVFRKLIAGDIDPVEYYENPLLTKDGKERLISFHNTVIRDRNGQTVGVLFSGEDVTDRMQAEEALRESENRYRLLAENASDVIWTMDMELKLTYISPSVSRLGGRTADEFMAETIADFLTEDSMRVAMKVLAEELAIEEKLASENKQTKNLHRPRTFELEFSRKDGTTFWTEAVANFIRDENGKPVGILGVTRDINERKQSEKALKESEEKYRTILENIEDGYYEVDIAGNLTFFNDSLCKITGSSKDELMGMNNREYMDEENAKKVYQIFNKVYNTGKPTKGFEYEIILRKDGSKRHVESSLSLIKDSEGNRVGFRGIIRDITDRKHMEAELIQTKDFLQNILDSSIDGITTTDLQGNVIYTSPRTKDILGYKQEKIIGKKAHSFYGNGKEDAKAIMKELTEKGELREHEMKFIRKDGELVDINLSASLLKDEKGEVIGTLGIYRDITEKKHLEAQLAQAQRVEAIGTLAGGIAHNFNNLLMAIQGNTSLMLLNKTSSDPDYERLRNIEKSVQSGSRLTRQLLGYAREGRYEIRPSSLNQLVEETSNTFGTTKKEITLHRELAKDLWGIKADQGQIEQVLLNLYVNAADAMPGGGDLFLKTMNVTHKDMKNKPYKAKPGNYVLLTVRDTGTGMEKKTMKRIFDPFFTTKGLAKGTGLGLASVYGIVKAHGGYIDVDSKKGHGTTFSIYLPGSERKVEKPVKSAKRITEGTGIILLVDDEEMVLDVGVQLLKTLGYTVLEAKGGKEAVEIYKANKDKIDMVILDMIMPGVGGGEAYDRMKEINPNIKVLLSSGYSINGQATEILERGCDGFIQKPFNMKQLSRSIREILDKQ